MLIFEVFIVLGDIFLNEFELLSSSALRRFFNITREDSLANWFSTMQTLLVALVLFIIAWLSQSKSNKKKKDHIGWWILGFFFAFMSLDDGSKLHERIGTAFKDWAEVNTSADGFLSPFLSSYGWQIALGPFFIAIGFYMIWFLWKQLKKNRLFPLFALAFLLLVTAVGMDFLEGMNLPGINTHSVKHTLKVIEEFFEMFANTVLLIVFLKVLFQQNKKISIEFKH